MVFVRLLRVFRAFRVVWGVSVFRAFSKFRVVFLFRRFRATELKLRPTEARSPEHPRKQDSKAITHTAPEIRTDPKLHQAMRGNSEVLRFLGYDSS